MTKIALLGDKSDDVIAHRAIPVALQLAANELNVDCVVEWLHSSEIELSGLSDYHGFWCVPASPYQNPQKVIAAIRHARESGSAFIGTCGGYQHAVLEYAQNVLGFTNADSAEDNPDTTMPLINAMFCALREKPGKIRLTNPSLVYSFYQTELIEEQYNCGFGVNKTYLSLFDNSELKFTGHDEDDDPRAFEISSHAFFIGTAFQPERSALSNMIHPLIKGFLAAASHSGKVPSQARLSRRCKQSILA